MKLSQYGYDFTPDMLAKYPAENRDEARLMVVNRATGQIEHRIFKDIIDYFEEKDVFVFNDTKVFPARLYGNKEKTGAEIEQIIQDNPLRNSFEVSVSAVDRASLDAVADRMAAIDGVIYVAYPAATIERLHATITKITIVLTAFGGALLIISLILLNNTIRLAIFSRRYLINTFKLVGATKGYIMRPFLGAAAKQGVWAGVTASLLFGGSIAALSGTMPEITASTQIVQIAVTVGGMILCGVVISLLFTAFAVNKFVNMKSNKIFLY